MVENVEPAPERTRLGGAATLLAAVAFVAVAGVPGLAAALAVLAGWYLLGGVYAFALGQVGVASLLTGAAVLELAVVEVGLLGALVAPAAVADRFATRSADSTDSQTGESTDPQTTDAATASGVALSSFRVGDSSFAAGPALLALGLVLAGGALAWASARTFGGLTVSISAVLLVAATGLAAYGLHRYQVVSLETAGGVRE